MEAMRKLDATLVAYLAGETKLQSKQLEPELELNLNSPNNESSAADSDEYVLEEFSDTDTDADEQTVEKIRREELQLFRRIKSMKLQLEALTLEPEGTKRMELLQNETRPIFTVECQLSHELIQHVPRYEMFHIMQFESEKFNSLTQCTRFGQEAQRDINLTPLIDELDALNGNCVAGNGNGAASTDMANFGRIHFAVWWREPGTCLNEMLGMGVFELRELYDAALLEQCKRITIQRRGVPLANIYLKINLLLCTLADTNNNNASDVVAYEPATEAVKEHGGKKKKGGAKRGDGNAAKNTKAGAGSTAAGTSAGAASASSSSNTTGKTNDGNDVKPDTENNFKAETLKVRLLTGLITAGEVRNLKPAPNYEYHLHVDRFWRSEPATAILEDEPRFHYEEQFAVIRDTVFLSNVKNKYLRLLIYQRPKTDGDTDGNGNPKTRLEPVGLALLPLHQFFIAFSNDLISNRLVREKLPVISIDAFTPVTGSDGTMLGEINCLLAIGSTEQIDNLKRQRGFRPLHTDMFAEVGIDRGDEPLYRHIRMPVPENIRQVIKSRNEKNIIRETVNMLHILEKALEQSRACKPTSGDDNKSSAQASKSPLPALPSVPPLSVASTSKGAATATTTAPSAAPWSTSPTLSDEEFLEDFALRLKAKTPVATDTTNPAAKLKALISKIQEEPTFQFELMITSAVGLVPYYTPLENTLEARRFPPGELPSTYVTFQAEDCVGHSSFYSSVEGKQYATKIVERSVHPSWDQKFLVTASTAYLDKPDKAFILKLWKRANIPSADVIRATSPLAPTPEDDAIIGFTEVYVSCFLDKCGVTGLFPVIDVNGWIRAQLQLKATALAGWFDKFEEAAADEVTSPKQEPKPELEPNHQWMPELDSKPKEISKSKPKQITQIHEITPMPTYAGVNAQDASMFDNSKSENALEEFGKSLNITHLNLNEAVKHKCIELEGISQRLRTRLADVTGVPLPTEFNMSALNNWLPLDEEEMAELGGDEELMEFTRDINNPPTEKAGAAATFEDYINMNDVETTVTAAVNNQSDKKEN
ncbi:unnamed protein product [Ceratitis capitata]|uniref:(Mediterranean fruit fly) hypothetical protein n=1 Tax=Ceratitis capitata TaxID=7213 RepID=A0A811V730_CERCA|nr:unnamed protein product [Ceratitis capitata]